MASETTCRVIPSSGAIYSSSDTEGRTFYYSSLNIEWSTKWKWKVHVGDLVAVSTALSDGVENSNTTLQLKKPMNAKSTKRQQQQRTQEIEKWQSNHYRKASTHWKVGLVIALSKRLTKTLQGGQFDCHVQWLDKAMDLPTSELKTFNNFRPFAERKGKKGSQMPHILINRPGDFGVISPLCILPVEIVITSKQYFTEKGVRETDESQYSLMFCCLKTRRDGFLATQDMSVYSEPNPDVWTFVNPPKLQSGSSNSTSVVSISDVPQPLDKAWKQWLSTISDAASVHNHSTLIEALKKGWSTTRRERHTKVVLGVHAKQKESVQQSNKSPERPKMQAKASAAYPITAAENASNRQNAGKQQGKRSHSASSKRDELKDSKGQDDEYAPKASKKKRGIRFSADTKQEAQRAHISSTLLNTNVNSTKRSRPLVSQTHGEVGTRNKSAKLVDDTDDCNSAATTEGNGSTVTQETHSTDTTLPTRGAGQRQHSASKPTEEEDESTTVCTLTSTSSYISEILPRWNIVPTNSDPIFEKGNKKYYGRVKMSISSNVLENILNTSNKAKLRDVSSQEVTFTFEIGSVVAVYCDQADSTDGKWSPFRLPWAIAQITSIINLEHGGDEEWQVGIRWFYRYSELTKTRQKLVKDSIIESNGLVETQESSHCSVMTILPAHIALTSDRNNFTACQPFERNEKGIPIICMLCEHISLSKNKINSIMDWDLELLKRQLSSPRKHSGIANPVKRAISRLPKALKERCQDWLRGVCQGSGKGIGETSFGISPAPSKPRKNILTPLSPVSPVYEQWGNDFYDVISIQVDAESIYPSYVSCQKEWSLAVGRVIPVRCNCVRSPHHKSNAFSPFRVPWDPAQVTSIYKTESGLWMMQIRWFQRFCDILDHHKESFKHLDHDHVVFETEVYEQVPIEHALPGKIVLTSSDGANDWSIKQSNATGLPLIPLLCSYICLDEEIDSSNDWTNYDATLSTIPAPLSRGLLLRPANRANKEWVLMLFRHYTKAIRNWPSDSDYDQLIGLSFEIQSNPDCRSHCFRASDVEVSAISPIVENEPHSLQFFRSLRIKVPQDYFPEPTMAMKRNKCYWFECSVGDVVCFFDDHVSEIDLCNSSKRLRHPYHPYNFPWSFGQVLSVWIDPNSMPDNAIKVELRRFFRMNQLPDDAITFAPYSNDSLSEEIFESDNVVVGIEAATIVGLAEIFLGDHLVSGTKTTSLNSFHVAQCRCKYFYMSTFKRVQPLFCSSVVPGDWNEALRRRGFNHSEVLKQNEDLKKLVSNPSQVSSKPNLFDLLIPKRKFLGEGSVASFKRPLQSSETQSSLYHGVVFNPAWSLYCATNIVFDVEEAKLCSWNLLVGDILAVKDHKLSNGQVQYPYKTCWYPCQLLSVCGERTNAQFEVRVLALHVNNGREEVSEFAPGKTDIVTAEDLLGPLVLHSWCTNLATKSTAAHTLPFADVWASRSLNLDVNYALTLSTKYNAPDAMQTILSGRAMTDNGLENSVANHRYLDRNLSNRRPGESWVVGEPFQIDLSKGKAFYEEVGLKPQFSEVSMMRSSKRNSDFMVLRTGDVVMVRFEGSKRHPFDCNWAVADVVAIFVEISRSSVDNNNLGKVRLLEKPQGRIKAEIRWFYEHQDFVSLATFDEVEDVNEVFETDHTQVVDVGNCIISHASLTDSQEKLNKTDNRHVFLCQRFWSTERKSLVPCSGLEGRKNRALQCSKCLPSQPSASALLQQLGSSTRTNRSLGWKDAMVRLQQKLTLKNASRHAYGGEDTLVGREKEISGLLSFLRSAIRGDSGTGEVKSSMIVAGPPGVGKTASVHAAISKLHEEQEKGLIPKFRFISLNGMEQREPNDTYIRFWESLTGTKHVGSHERACESLEEYFTMSSSKRKDSATVVLLDEIDYLITEKQSVLYNFFDWPKRVANTPNGRRLVVVGLSNTLNLVEQLIPSVQSRIGIEKCIFKAYSLKDTVNILKTKMAAASQLYNFFEEDAILFAAKKTAALSGDVRKAMQICRVAAEAVTQRFDKEQGRSDRHPNSYPKIKISDVQRASQESFNKAVVTAVSFCTPLQALLLIAVASLCRATGREVGGFDIQDVLTKMEAIASGSGDPQYLRPPSFNEALQLVNLLGEMNLIKLKTVTGFSGQSPWPMVSLVVDELTLLKGFRNTPHKPLAQKHLPSLF